MTYCKRCDRSFDSSTSAFDQHRTDSPHHYFCRDCSEEFLTREKLEVHWARSPRHSYCRYCKVHFEDSSDLDDHCDEKHHSYCRPCNRVFIDGDSLEQHYSKSSRHYYCPPCKRLFRSENNLINHTNSSTHRKKNVPCLFEGCERKFVSRYAVAIHLEYGGCKSGIDRDTLDEMVRRYDRDNIITDPAHQHYICPPSTCRTQFSTPSFSSLCQHMESETCEALTNKDVRRLMDRIFGRMPRLAN